MTLRPCISSIKNSATQEGALPALLLKSILAALVAGAATQAHATPQKPWVIYGSDDRIEVFEEKDPARRELANSVVALLPKTSIEPVGGMSNVLNGKTLGQGFALCPTEKYFDQITPAFCSGVLVADNIVATAGHCVLEPDFCNSTAFVFGFNRSTSTHDPNNIQTPEIYHCKQVIHSEMDGAGADFALVQLDRSVVGHKPLPIADLTPAAGDDVFVIGHPVGLPAKIAGGAKVRNQSTGFYVANLDTFGGNSGSPVFNSNNEVAGILVRGEQDFEPNGMCNVTFHCQDGLCRGEDVTEPSIVKNKLWDIVTTPGAPTSHVPSALHRVK